MDRMPSRERVLAAFDHKKPDCVPRNVPNLAPALETDVAAYFCSDFRGISFQLHDKHRFLALLCRRGGALSLQDRNRLFIRVNGESPQ